MPDPARLTILNYPDPVLKKRAIEVESINDSIRRLAERMIELMHDAKGIGLAAPQVGISLRLFVCNAMGQPGDDLVCINPKFIELSGGEEGEEGCLSIPEVTVRMRRAKHAVMTAQDASGGLRQLTGSDLIARIWQHETDHLEGRLIVDHMSSANEISNRKALKKLRDDYNRKKRKRA
ncbi:MAG: peptide deformylase [Planctomycetes bacterium]|nr:peptide deformylase [Planctomycetota bacterium]